MKSSTIIYGDVPHVPKAVSTYMAKLARKSNKAQRGTAASKRRAKRAARARWADKK